MTGKAKMAACVAAVAALLMLDAALTWRIASSRLAPRAGSARVDVEAVQDPLERFRLEREQLRAREEAQLKEIIYATDTQAAIVGEAQRRLMDLLAAAGAESAIEGILEGRGFEEVLASVSPEGASVLVRGEDLTAAQTSVILDLVMRQTGLTGGNVKIIPVK